MGTQDAGVVVQSKGGLCTEVLAGEHSLVVDEPQELGGTDSGPTPYGYLLAALGSCTAMTLRMYADRKGWPLESVKVRLTHDRMHAKDCEQCETEDGRVERIEREIELVGPLEEAQRRRLLAIADRCPVHQTLGAEVVIENRLA